MDIATLDGAPIDRRGDLTARDRDGTDADRPLIAAARRPVAPFRTEFLKAETGLASVPLGVGEADDAHARAVLRGQDDLRCLARRSAMACPMSPTRFSGEGPWMWPDPRCCSRMAVSGSSSFRRMRTTVRTSAPVVGSWPAGVRVA